MTYNFFRYSICNFREAQIYADTMQMNDWWMSSLVGFKYDYCQVIFVQRHFNFPSGAASSPASNPASSP